MIPTVTAEQPRALPAIGQTPGRLPGEPFLADGARMIARVLALTLVLAFGGEAASREAGAVEAADAAMRGSSAMAAITQFCTTYYVIDTPYTVKYGAALADVAKRILGFKYEAAFNAELKRRYYEVQITGDRVWCAGKRDTYNANRLPFFLN